MKRGFICFLFFGVFLTSICLADANDKKVVEVSWDLISDGIIAYNLDETVMQGTECEAYTKASQKKPALAEKFLRIKGVIRVCICPEFNVTITKGEAFRSNDINSRAEAIFGEFFPEAKIKMIDKRRQSKLANR